MSAGRLDRRRDVAEMLNLALAFPTTNLHTIDLPYRLSSWALDEPENVALWRDGGRLVGWAVLQTPFWALDVSLDPDAEGELLPRVLEWADARALAVRGGAYDRPSWYVHVFGDLEGRRSALERHGYACQADIGEDSWTRVLLRRTGCPPDPQPIPPGFAIRPLVPSDVDAYVELHRAAFESKNMTREWRARTLSAAHHRQEADLVAVAPDGRLVGFCIGWLGNGLAPTGQIEPLGIARDAREHGLGAALLTVCVRRLLAAGAHDLLVETDTYRAPALGLYEGLGFEPLRDVFVYRKDARAI
jgi:ribosomal protein S18 acetylase RimI-like enzyme